MKKIMTFKLEPELKVEIEKASKKIGVSSSAFIRMAIIEKLNKVNK